MLAKKPRKVVFSNVFKTEFENYFALRTPTSFKYFPILKVSLSRVSSLHQCWSTKKVKLKIFLEIILVKKVFKLAFPQQPPLRIGSGRLASRIVTFNLYQKIFHNFLIVRSQEHFQVQKRSNFADFLVSSKKLSQHSHWFCIEFCFFLHKYVLLGVKNGPAKFWWKF